MHVSEFSQWAERQLDLAGYRPAEGGYNQIVHTSVMSLCRAFGEMNFAAAPPGQEKMIIDLFTELANHRSLPVAGDTRVWVPSRQAPPGPGTIVRVISDGFDGEQGRLFNGREAVVAGARRGDFIIEFTDEQEPAGARLLASQLETRIG
jgi:hypothetical protein